MAEEPKKTIKTKSPTLATGTAVAAREKPAATRSAVRSGTVKAAAPAAKKLPQKRAAAKTATTAANKTVAQPPTARKSPPAKKNAVGKPSVVAKEKKKNKPAKVKKIKLVRDSFTMPEREYAVIAALKRRCLRAGMSAKKSEILRAAVANLAKLADASLIAAVRRLEIIKTGRPAKGPK